MTEEEQDRLAEELKHIEESKVECYAKKAQFQSYIKMINYLLLVLFLIFIAIYIQNLLFLGIYRDLTTLYFGYTSNAPVDWMEMTLMHLFQGFVIHPVKSFFDIFNIFILFVVIFITRAVFVSRVKYWDSKLNANDRRRKELKAEMDVRATYFERLVRINLDNLSEYYELVQTHTNKSFQVTLLACIMGVGLIFFGLLFGWTDNSRITYISAGSGIIIEFISGIFFYLYNKTVTQLKEYHDSLLEVQNVLLSFKIVEDMKDAQVKAKNVENMIHYLVGKKE